MSELTRRQFIGTATGLVVASSMLALPVSALTINPRSTWAVNRPPKGPPAGEDVKFLLVHHSASRNGHTSADAPAILRSFYDYHTSPEKGWNDIAYNFLIDSGGGVWEGRAGSIAGPVAGGASGGNQGFSQLVCLIGDYNSATPTPASLSSLVALLGWLADRYGVDTSPGAVVTFTSRGSNKWPSGASVTTPTITGHRNMSRTSCPGSNLNSYVVGGLMADVTSARGGSPVTSTAVAASSTAAAVTPSPSESAPGSAPAATETPDVTTSTVPLTDTEADPVPTAGSSGSVVVAQESSSTSETTISDLTPVIITTTTTTIPPTPPPTRSPLVLVAGGVAAVATLLAAWRARRLSGR